MLDRPRALPGTTPAQFHVQTTATPPLRTCVEQALTNYFAHLGDTAPTNLYELVMAEVEVPLLQVALRQWRGNQTKVAHMLGLSRGTLRKKLKHYQLD